MTTITGAATLDDALAALAAEADEWERQGEETIVFCEDRLTLLAERAILSVRGGTMRTEVTTFRRFLGRTGARSTLSKQGSVLEISALLARHADKLSCFRRNAAQAVYETIAQLSASCVDGDMLRTAADEAGGLLGRKLHDLAFLLGEYRGFLKERGLLDENGYLALLPAAMEKCLPGKHVIFFAFPSFTRQAKEGVRAAFRYAKSVSGIFLAGREEFYTNEGAAALRAVAESAGPVIRRMARSSLAGEALALSRTLFASEWEGERVQADHVRILTPRDEAEEMDTVAALIKKYTARGKRYKDLAVLAGGDMLLFAKKAFSAYGIPYYADAKRPFSEHPFCAFLLSVIRAAGTGVLPEDADEIASSVYFGEGSEYRNYLMRYGAYRGGFRREIPENEDIARTYGDLACLRACREKLRAAVDLFPEKGTGARYAEGIRKLWELVRGEEVTQSLARTLPAEDAAFLDVSPLWDILGETEAVAGSETFRASEFAGLLKNGFEALTVSVLPQYADAVFVGDVTDSKIVRADVLFCVGLTDEVPRTSEDTAVITDGEIRRLGTLEVEIDPAIAVVNARAREALVLNLCSFGEELYLSCPVRKKGVEAAPSELFYYVDRAFSPAPMSELFPYDCSAFAPALLSYFRDADEVESMRPGDRAETLIARYSSVKEALGEGVYGQRTDPDALRARSQKQASFEAGELWLGRDVSPTLLEEYFSCPYKGFAMRALRLAERDERTIPDPADAGTFVHTVLERTARSFNSFSSEEACRAAAEEIAEALIGEPRFSSVLATAAGSYSGKRLIGEAVAVTVAAYRHLAGSEYRVRAAEQEIALPGLSLRGKADRVDECGDHVRVIDYKTGSVDESALGYYTGRKLQLELYLKAASEGGMPAGAFYFPAADDFMKEGETKFRMKGFYCSDEEIVREFDPGCGTGKSEFFDSGSATRGLPGEQFGDFLDYAVLVSEQAEREMRAGNLSPSPYDGTCTWCKLKGMCGFTGTPRKEDSIKCAEIAEIGRRAKQND